jgi:iron complex transport system substrate-binding protein
MKTIIIGLSIIVLSCPALFSERIVSMAPALTEIIYALGRGDCLVGNTRFCDFPPQAKTVARIGGLMDLNLEVLIQLKPDLIILYPESMEKVRVLKERARLLPVRHGNLDDLYQSIRIIAKALEREKRGIELVSNMKNSLADIQQKIPGFKKKVKTLLVAGRNPDQLANLTIIGKKDFLNEILENCGGINAYEGNINYPTVSVESIVSMNPEWIIEFSVFFQGIDRQKVMGLWGRYPVIPAVKKKNIRVITDPKWLRPGPRIVEIARELYQLLHNYD